MNDPIRLYHLFMQTAFRLKIFGDDALGKVTTRCKVGAGIVNFLLEKNTVFLSAGAAGSCLPVYVRPLNDETFKSAVTELMKCTSDTNLQRNYVGDGNGDPQLAGSGIPPIALTSGESPGSEMLLRRSLHEVMALFESQAYLKNPSASEITAARNQALVLDGIARVLNGRPCTNENSSEPSTSATANSTSSGNSGLTNPDEAAASPMSSNDANKGEKRNQNPRLSQWPRLQ